MNNENIDFGPTAILVLFKVKVTSAHRDLISDANIVFSA